MGSTVTEKEIILHAKVSRNNKYSFFLLCFLYFHYIFDFYIHNRLSFKEEFTFLRTFHTNLNNNCYFLCLISTFVLVWATVSLKFFLMFALFTGCTNFV